EVDREPGKSTGRAGDDEPPLAAAFWTRHCRNAQRFWQEWGPPHASRAARVASCEIHGRELEPQNHAQADAYLQRLPPVVREARHDRQVCRCRQLSSVAV